MPIDDVLGAEIVSHLVRVSALPAGHVVFDDTARSAFVTYADVENLEYRVRTDGRIDRPTLAYLRPAGSKLHS